MSGPLHLAADVIDRLAIDALPAADKQTAESHLQSCARCTDDLATLRADMQHFQQFVLPRTQDRVRAKVQRTSSLWNPNRWMMPAFALAGAATLALIALPKQSSRLPARYEGVKGGPILSVYALRQGQQAELAKQDHVASGDQLRFVVQPSGYGYVLIASVDGKGSVEAFYPPEGKRSAVLQPGKQALPGAIELDATPGPERIYAYFSRAPLDLDALADKLKAHPEAPPQPDGSAPVQVFTFDKVSK